VTLVPIRLVRLDRGRDEPDRLIVKGGVARGTVCDASCERGHRVGEESGQDDVRVPLVVVAVGLRAPRRHDSTAKRVGRGTVDVVPVLEVLACHPSEPPEVDRCELRIQRGDEVIHMNERRGPSPVVPPWRRLPSGERLHERRVDALALILVGHSEVQAKELHCIVSDRRDVVCISDVGHVDRPARVDNSSRWQ